MTQLLSDGASSGRAQPALAVAHVSSGYGTTAVLRDVSLEVAPGSVTALLGPNGAGKTTLLRVVSGLLPATEGSVCIDGTDVTRAKPYARFDQGLCHIPEGRGIFRSLTVRENLLMMADKRDESEAIARATDSFPILGDRLSQRAGTLSGGEQQMLALSAAYLRDPHLVLVDEASLGLAPIVVDEIFAFLKSLTARGAALLLVDQFVHRALGMASAAYVLNRGAIAFAGTAAALLEADLFEQYLGRGQE
jgi:branched-chain amino acid transport system ATP-binding protein